MVIFFLEVILPIVALAILFVALRIYMKIQHPAPLVLGCIIPKLCVVASREILAYNKGEEGEEPRGRRLRREVRRKEFRVNWAYLCEEARNTNLFQRALRFEKLKIDPEKSGLEYEQREILILELVNEAAALRWKQFRWQLTMLIRGKLGLSIDKKVCSGLMMDYKGLEDEFLALADMADDRSLRRMLADRLGLTGWGVINGGEEPA